MKKRHDLMVLKMCFKDVFNVLSYFGVKYDPGKLCEVHLLRKIMSNVEFA